MKTTKKTNWSAVERDLLCQHYATMPKEELSALLGRSISSILNRAEILNLSDSPSAQNSNKKGISITHPKPYLMRHEMR